MEICMQEACWRALSEPGLAGSEGSRVTQGELHLRPPPTPEGCWSWPPFRDVPERGNSYWSSCTDQTSGVADPPRKGDVPWSKAVSLAGGEAQEGLTCQLSAAYSSSWGIWWSTMASTASVSSFGMFPLFNRLLKISWLTLDPDCFR